MYEREVCPMCGHSEHTEEDDLEKPLYYFANGKRPMYKKKKICKRCSYKW